MPSFLTPLSAARLLLLSLLVVVPLLTAVALGQTLDISTVLKEYSASNPRVQTGNYGGELRRAPEHNVPLTSLNIVADSAASNFLANIYPSFVEFNPFTSQPYCFVCVSYTRSSSRLEITLELREGIVWTDGTPLTADDVVATSRIFSDSDNLTNYRRMFDDGENLIRFEKVDADTVLMIMSRPLDESTWMSRLSWPVLPNHVFGEAYESGGMEAVKELYPLGSEDLVSAGYWRFHSYSENGTLILRENREYNWVVDAFGNKLPYVDRLVYTMPESTEAAALAAGAVDFAGRISTREDLQSLQGAGKVVREIRDQTRAAFVTPNFTHPDPAVGQLMRSEEFRIALSKLIDRESYREEMYGDLAEPAYNYNLLPGYRDLPYPHHVYEPEEARRILQGLGLERDPSRTACPAGCFVQANGKPLRLMLSHFDRPDYNPFARVIASMLREEGLEVIDDPLGRQDYIDRVHMRGASTFREFDLIYSAPGSSIPGREFLQAMFGLGADFRYWGIGPRAGEPPSHVQSWEERLSDISSLILGEVTEAEHVALVAEGTYLFAEYLPMIPVVELKTLLAYDPRLANTADQIMDEYTFAFVPGIYPLIYIR